MQEADEACGAAGPAEAAERDDVIPAGARAEIESAISALRMWLVDAERWRTKGTESLASPDPDVLGIDVHTIVREWLALKQEVRLQSRGAKSGRDKLEQAVGAFRDGLDDVQQQLQRALDPLISERGRLRDEFQGRWESQQRYWVEAFIEVRDALARGAEASGRAAQPTGWRRWFGLRERLNESTKGYELAIRRIDTVLTGHGIHPIECVGQRVDPQRMRVVEVVDRDDLSEGTVVDVVRPGYFDGSRVIRFAEVRAVAKGKGN